MMVQWIYIYIYITVIVQGKASNGYSTMNRYNGLKYEEKYIKDYITWKIYDNYSAMKIHNGYRTIKVCNGLQYNINI